MYLPDHFSEQRLDVLHALIQAHPLAAMVTHNEDGLDANHLPFLVTPPTADVPYGVLRGHVARSNPVWQKAATGKNLLVIFQGAHAYISPRWYAEKKHSGAVVPTYNYVVVHAHGPLRIIEDRQQFLALLTQLSAHFEHKLDQPWKVSDAPAEYIDRMMDLIVGIEIPIQRICGKWKTSQNKTTGDRMTIANGLRESGHSEVADMASIMEQQLFI
ncbi:FMN-binding negative transcriptional regulator [Undibacterium sp. Di26W]|uniref:FMN-binding negative transcriptional regulator n=1 Tax=Undibacterium sp. Di26W TaxID=3413035 RepID=UPI003BF31502